MRPDRRWTAAALFALALLALPLSRPAASGQQAVPFSSGVSLVALNVTVQDETARYVGGLRAEDFAVYEDGVRQQVRFVEAGSIPIDLIVMLDTSRSMTGKVAIVQAAARGFLETLRPADRGAVVAFNDRVNLLEPLTSDHSVLAAAVASTTLRGNTALRTALYVTLKQFGQPLRREPAAVRRQAIAVLSDGEDTASLTSFDDLLALTRQMGVAVYTVRLENPDDLFARQGDPRNGQMLSDADYEMKALARETGAQAFFPAPQQLAAVYAAIAKELANQYSIGYEPVNGASDGRFRRVSVQIVSRPGLRARTRAGYTAGADRGAGPP
jgi:VWFA-related protein